MSFKHSVARLAWPLLAPLVALTALTACSDDDAAPADEAAVNVVVGLYPFQFLVQEVGGDLVAVTNLTQPGAEPHDLELTPGQVAAVGRADLVVYLPELQSAVDEAVAQAGDGLAVVDVSQAVALLPGHDEQGEAMGTDPHVWLDPERMADIATATAEALAQADPDHAEAYQSGAGRLRASLAALDQQYADGLADCARQVFITSHAAFGYLADRYGLTQVPIAGLSPDAEPSPARVAAVQALATQHGVTTIFFEVLASPALADAIASDLGLRTAVLDPIEGLSDQSQADDYVGLMRANLEALRQANQCS
ncbi:MAG: metal ABC transporter substrate-binding protein [Propionibacteriaceae bacterium]|nr:metal ABC transporter substrate-binding protein [Propionibacteriaceae bacterium]